MTFATPNIRRGQAQTHPRMPGKTRIADAEAEASAPARLSYLQPLWNLGLGENVGCVSASGFLAVLKRLGGVPRLALSILVLVWLGTGAFALAVEGLYSAQAQQEFARAQKQYQEKPQDTQAAWEFARACFDLAEFATNHTERAELAELGIAASRQAIASNSNSAPAHYHLGLNLGQLARTRSLGALKLVRQMEPEFKRAIQLDPHFDYAGPNRTLGLLYLDAPTIGSIGDRAKAKTHLHRAVELAPQYPDNHLCLLEAYLKWNDRGSARRELKALEEIWSKARAELAGPRWAPSWADWKTRLQKAKAQLDEGSKALESPRNKD